MGKLTVFDHVSLDGYFTDPAGDMSAFHRASADPEWAAFTAENARGGDAALLFGRKTYELMASFWPSEVARQQLPEVAAGMNRRAKYVASRTLTRPAWSNTTVLRGELVEAVRRLKAGPEDLLVLGSGTLVAQLTDARLIDAYTLVTVPILLGGGRGLFAGAAPARLRRTELRGFANGNVVATYVPA